MDKVVFLWLLATSSGVFLTGGDGEGSSGGDGGGSIEGDGGGSIEGDGGGSAWGDHWRSAWGVGWGSALCPGPSKAFQGSCYEVVSARRSFWDAQARCERDGGHLAFVRSEETQRFLGTQLDPDRDWWLGLAPPGPAHCNTTGGTARLAWLDGSDVSWSAWAPPGPQPGACAAFLRGRYASRWTATQDCHRELNSVCQYEWGRVVACDGRDVKLLCPPGHVIKVDRGFYGRETPHYCRRPLSLPTTPPTPDQCAAVGLLQPLAEQCDGLQVCWVSAAGSWLGGLGGPGPVLGGYLWVQYRCEDGRSARSPHLTIDQREVKSLFLPAGQKESKHKVSIQATIQGSDCSTTMTAEVKKPDLASRPSVEALQSVVQATVADLKEQGLLTPETLGQMFRSVADELNQQTDRSQKDAGKKLRGEMLSTMEGTMESSPSTTTQGIQVAADGLAAIVQQDDELSPNMQNKAASMLRSLGASLVSVDKGSYAETLASAAAIVAATSNMFASAPDRDVVDALLDSLDKVQSGLLKDKEADSGPVHVHQGKVGLLVNRISQGMSLTDPIVTPHPSSPRFTLPPVITDLIPDADLIDVRMSYVTTNPFAWNEQGNISGVVGSLSLLRPDGSILYLSDMPEEIEILLPRPVEMQQGGEAVMDLANHSTVILTVPTAESTLLIKMLPSVERLLVNVYLGYGHFPTASNYSLMTRMPLEGTTPEDRYTWLVEPEHLGGQVGLYYLVLRPVVGPGVKTLNATVNISTFTGSCQFWNETESEWRNFGCRVGVRSTSSQTQCLCNHLTAFGSSFFVAPNIIDMTRTAELFGSFAQNPVVVCFVGSLVLGYLLAVVWARRKDLQDAVKLQVTVLEDNDPLEDYRYVLSVHTGHRRGASTSSQVTVTLAGSEGRSEPHHLGAGGRPVFERGGVDLFLLTTPVSLGRLQTVRLWHNNAGSDPGWYVNKVVVKDLQTEQKWHFLCNRWLAVDVGDCTLDVVFPVATEMDLKRFSHLFYSKTFAGFSDGHLWFSVVSRPPSSPFTRVQRVSCCFSLLLCTMLTSIMFYGVPQDPSEQVMDLGNIEFTWQQVMIGVQSSLLVFPVNLLIISIFRYARPRETQASLGRPRSKEDPPDPESPPTHDLRNPVPQPPADCTVTVESVVKDIRKTACLLSKTLKSGLPALETGDGGDDINAVLSVVAAIVRQHLETGAEGDSSTRTDTQDSLHLDTQPQIQEGDSEDGGPPQTRTNDSVQTHHRAKTRHLLRQLCYLEGRLDLLDPTSHLPPDQTSHRPAREQVRALKHLLQEYTLKVHNGDPDQVAQRPESIGPEEAKERRRRCCGGARGLPWGCVFLGWFLVVATSVVAGFFTMLYGLKFGKQLSVSWLISMAVSFFESLLLIQPLKVLSLAVFFALVFKKDDEDDDENIQFHKSIDSEAQRGPPVCRDSRLYRPPPPVDTERMRRNRVKEQRAYALIKEILTYVGFMWTLLLVAYSQRDPDAVYLSRHLRRSFSRHTRRSMTHGQVFSWANGSLLDNLFGKYPGFITDGNSKLVGAARIRQVRVRRGACAAPPPLPPPADRVVADCRAPYSWEREDLGSYDPRWRGRTTTPGDNGSDGQVSPWTYQRPEDLRAHTIWGNAAVYRAGGFAADLGPDLRNASIVLEYLFSNTWLDSYTRAVFVEFTAYNANVNLFCIVTLILETTATGAFEFQCKLQNLRLYQSPGGFQVFIITVEVLYFLFVFYYMFLQGKRMKEQRWAYLRCQWNLLELSIICLSWASLAAFIQRALVGSRDMEYYHHHKHRFASFHATAAADAALGYLVAFLVLLASVKLWRLLRLNAKLHMMTATLRRAWGGISGFLLVITLTVLAYSIFGNLLFGGKLSSYRTLWDSLSNLISLQLGIFNYKEVLDASPWLGTLFLGSCTVFMSYVVLNLFISVILEAFSYEREHYQPSEEEEIVDLVLMKLFSLLGIRSAGPGPDPDPDPVLGKDPGPGGVHTATDSSHQGEDINQDKSSVRL
ncbi:unnamed protein product [Merluccius merluccius]